MRFLILGSVEVERDGRPLALGPPRQRALLAALLLRRGRVVAVQSLVDDLWPDDPPRTAAQIVRVYVSQLRKTLGAGLLETAGTGYRLCVDEDDVDAWRFERLVAEGGERARAGDEGAPAILREALALWRGPPLGDLGSEPFAVPDVARLEERRLACLEDLYACELDAGRSAELVADLDELVTRHPQRERLCAALMLALYRSGRQADALSVYRRVRRHLDDSQGLEPGESLRRLEAQMLRQDPSLDGAALGPAEPVRLGAGWDRRAAIAGLLAAGVLAAGVALLVLHGRSGNAESPPLRPIALAMFGGRPVPNGSVTATENTIELSLLQGVQEAVRVGIPGRVAYVGGRTDAQLQQSLGRVARRSGLVLIGATPDFGDVAAVARRYPNTRFALIAGSVHDFRFPPNVAGIPFDDHEVGYLAGYLAALEAGPAAHISAVGGAPLPTVRHIAAGYRAGAERARPGTVVRITYTDSFVNEALCERAADRQIDAGSTVVFDIAGDCGFGALQAADTRGVWGIGVDSDLSSLGPHILASSIKRIDSAVRIAMQLYVAHRLPRGRDVLLNVGNDGVALVGMNDRVSPAHRLAVARVAASMRRRDESGSR